MNSISLGMRNAFRNVTRSISIITILGLSLGLSLSMLIAHQAVSQKITDVKKTIGNTITISPAGFSQFSQANNALTTSQLQKVSSLAHITNLNESLTDRLTTIGSTQPSFGRFGQSNTSTDNQTNLKSPVTINFNNQSGERRFFISGGGSAPTNFSPPITIIGTNSPADLGTASGVGAVTASSGKIISGTADTNDALISDSMANKNNLKVGSTFSAYGKNLTVAGIFKTSTDAGKDVVIVSLPAAQRLSEQSGIVTNATATVDSVDNLSSVTSAIKNVLGTADVTNAADQVNQSIQPLDSVKKITLFSLFGSIVAGSVIILLTMIMIVRERRREIGILKAIGASNSRVISQFMSEAVTLTLAGAIIGIVIGVIASNPVTNTLVSTSVNATNSNTSQLGGTGGQMAGPPRGGFRTGSSGGPNFTARSTNGRSFFGRNANSLENSIKNVHANAGLNIIAWGIGAALLIAVIGSSSAGWLISRVRPSEVMRAE